MAAKNDLQQQLRNRAMQHIAGGSRGGSGTISLPNGVDFMRAEEGKIKFDIIPFRAKTGGVDYQQDYKVHYDVGPEHKSVVCPTTFGQPCPLCDEANRLRKSTNSADAALAKELRPKDKTLFNVVLKDDPKNKKIQVYDVSYWNFTKQLCEELQDDDNEEHRDFATPSEGKTLSVRFGPEATGQGRSRIVAKKITFLERSENYKDSIIDEAVKLDTVFKLRTYDELLRMMHGDAPESDELEDSEAASDVSGHEDAEEQPTEEEVPRPAQKPTRSKAKGAPPPPKASDDDGAEDDDAAPAKSRAFSKSVAAHDDAEEDAPPKASGKEKCPCGFRFGVDTNKHDDCDRCDVFDDCYEIKRANRQ